MKKSRRARDLSSSKGTPDFERSHWSKIWQPKNLYFDIWVNIIFPLCGQSTATLLPLRLVCKSWAGAICAAPVRIDTSLAPFSAQAPLHAIEARRAMRILTGMRTLVRDAVSQETLVDEDYRLLAQCKYLQHLDIHGLDIFHLDVQNANNLTHLVIAQDLSRANGAAERLQAMFSNVQSLGLKDSRYASLFPSVWHLRAPFTVDVGLLTNLKSLSLGRRSELDLVHAISLLSGLRSLELLGVSDISLKMFPSLPPCFANLHVLTLSPAQTAAQRVDLSALQLATALTELTLLADGRSLSLHDLRLPVVIPSLVKLTVTGFAPHKPPRTTTTPADSLQQLTKLGLNIASLEDEYYFPPVSIACLKHVVSGFTALHSLELLFYNCGWKRQALDFLFMHMQNLQHLCL